MGKRAVYLAVSDWSSRQRGHFAIFIQNETTPDSGTGDGMDESPVTVGDLLKQKGTIIQVTGEPLMQGYKLEFKRNCDCSTQHPVQKLVPLGFVEETSLTSPAVGDFSIDSTPPPQSALERVAAQISPPAKGQDIRAFINGVTTRRCQEWTKEFVQKLADQDLIGADAPERVQGHRDSPTHGIFGYKGRDDVAEGSTSV